MCQVSCWALGIQPWKKDAALTSQSLTSSGEDAKHNNYANDHFKWQWCKQIVDASLVVGGGAGVGRSTAQLEPPLTQSR